MNKFATYYKQIEVLKFRTYKQAKTLRDKLDNKMICDNLLLPSEYGNLASYMNTIVDMKEAEDQCANYI